MTGMIKTINMLDMALMLEPCQFQFFFPNNFWMILDSPSNVSVWDLKIKAEVLMSLDVNLSDS